MKFIQPDWPAPTHIKAYTTLRTGWQGKKLKESEAATLAATQDLVRLLELPSPPIFITQKHTADIVRADQVTANKAADGVYTNQPNQVCMALTADCLPILFCNTSGTQVAAIHAGWRGLATGIIKNTVQALQQAPTDLMVWLGPAIGPLRFEVGLDVFEAFVQQDPDTHAGFQPQSQNKWLANLYLLARIKLQKLGINQVFGGNFCTYNQPELFFSFRRDKEQTGHMASLIWISEKKC